MPVSTGVIVGVAVAVATPVGAPVGVVLGVFVRVVVGVAVAVLAGVALRAFVGVVVGVLVRVFVGVVDGVGVAVVPPTGVLVGVPLGVGVQGGIRTAPAPELKIGVFVPESVPETSISSAKKEIVAWQAGAVSSTLPVQVSPGVPFGCSVVTGVPPTVQGTAAGELPCGVLRTTSPTTVLAGSRFWTRNVHVKVAPGVMNASGQVLVTAIPVVTWAEAADANTKPESTEGNHLFIGALVSFEESKPSTPD